MEDSTEPGTDTEATLPFSAPKQEAILGYLLSNESFFRSARNRIQPTWWTSHQHQQLWDLIVKISDRYGGRWMKPLEITESAELCGMDLKDQNKTRSVINLCVKRCGDFGLDVLQSELTSWLRCRIYMTEMKRSENLFNAAARGGQDSKKLTEAFEAVKKMNRMIDDATFENAAVADMSNPVADFQNAIEDAQGAISFGLPLLNKLLLPVGGGAGSLLPGDMTVLLAPTNIGKTTTMVTIASYNILKGKDVLLITHEGRISDIKMKIWQSIMGLTFQNVLSGLGDPKFLQYLTEFRGIVDQHLEFLPLNKAGMTVEEVEAIIRRRQERWQGNHGGKGFDLMIDDYAAKLTTQQARGGQFALRQIHEVVYNYFTQIALEHNIHVVTAIQTNREGSKTNRKVGRDVQIRLLTMEDVMESWGPMTTATNVISINRDPQAQAKGIVTFYICKSRSSEVGWAVAVESDYAAARSHWDDKRATYYRGTSPHSEKIESFLEGYNGQETPWEQIKPLENGHGHSASA